MCYCPRVTRRLRNALILGGILVAGEALWLVAANRALDGDRLREALNRRPEKLLVTWESGYTLYPGHVALRGVTLRNQGTKSQLELRLDRVSALFNPLPLLWKTINVVWAEADGAEFRMRRRPATIEELEAGKATAPPIEGFDYAASMRDPAATPKVPRWAVSFTGASVDGIREVWIDAVRLRGPGRVHAGVKVGPGRRLSVVRGVVELPDLSIGLGVEDPIEHARLSARLSILPYDYSVHRQLGFLPFTSGRLKFEGGTGGGTPLLDFLFRRVTWLNFEGASSFETADLVLDRGVLQPGSRLVANTRELAVELFQFRAEGEAIIEMTAVEGPAAPEMKARVVVKRFGMGLKGYASDAVFGQKMIASATVENLVLGGPPPEVDIRIDLVNVRAPDVTRANYLIPAGLGLVLREGTARIDGYVRANSRHANGSGNVTLRADRIVLDAGDLRVGGSLSAALRLGGLDARRVSFELSGTKIRLSDFTLAEGNATGTSAPDVGWWADLSIPTGVLDYDDPELFDGEIAFRMRDLRPILGFFLKGRPLPKFGRRLLDDAEIGGSARIIYAGDRLEVRDLRVDSELIEVDAQLDIEGRSVRGDLLALYAILGVGIGVEDREVEVHFVGARDWYLDRIDSFWDVSDPEKGARR